MLVLCMQEGDITTITTPDGPTLSVVVLDEASDTEGVRLGISAPHDYRILRASSRNERLGELRNIPIFEVRSALHQTQIIAAQDYTSAIEWYQQQYPNSCAIEADTLNSPAQHPLFPRMEAIWLEQHTLPFGIAIG